MRARLVRILVPWALCFAGLSGLWGCDSKEPVHASAATAAAPAAPALLRRGNGQEPDSLDPHLAALNEAGRILRDVYEGLTVLDTNAHAAPGVAERWEVSADGLTYTFHLRSDARWSNGAPVTADDFVQSWRRLVDPKTGGSYAKILEPVVGVSATVAGDANAPELGFRASDPRTLVVTLNQPTAYFPVLLTHWATLPTYRGQPPGKPGEAVSNGAFTLADWAVGSHVTLKRNRAYWNDAATQLDEVRFYHFADINDEYMRYRGGELDITSGVPLKPLETLRAAHGDELRLSPMLGVYYYGFNLETGPFAKSKALRQALAMTVDREKLVSAVTGLGEQPAYGWVPAGMPDYTAQQPEWAAWPYERRLAEARKLYAQAGYSADRPLRFELRYNTGGAHERIALAVSAMWKAALGVEVTLKAEEFKSLLQAIQRGETAMFRSSWTADYPDPYSFAQVFSSRFGLNLPRYRNAAYDRDLAAAVQEPDTARRRALLEQAERQLIDDSPVVPLYFSSRKTLVSARVDGPVVNALDLHYSRALRFRANESTR